MLGWAVGKEVVHIIIDYKAQTLFLNMTTYKVVLIMFILFGEAKEVILEVIYFQNITGCRIVRRFEMVIIRMQHFAAFI